MIFISLHCHIISMERPIFFLLQCPIFILQRKAVSLGTPKPAAPRSPQRIVQEPWEKARSSPQIFTIVAQLVTLVHQLRHLSRLVSAPWLSMYVCLLSSCYLFFSVAIWVIFKFSSESVNTFSLHCKNVAIDKSDSKQ